MIIAQSNEKLSDAQTIVSRWLRTSYGCWCNPTAVICILVLLVDVDMFIYKNNQWLKINGFIVLSS